MMKILTLFLALFLTLLPEGASAFNYSQGQDVVLEEVNEIEEEAVFSPEKSSNTFSNHTAGNSSIYQSSIYIYSGPYLS